MRNSDSKPREEEAMVVDVDKIESQVSQPGQIFDRPARQIALKFEDVMYKIKVKTAQGSCFNKKSKTVERPILRGISGVVKPGEMLAMLGPSGSGKTTLLTALGGRLGGRLAGNVTFNGKPYSNHLKRSIGFVTQDDVLYAHLTVTETLVYTALLRLPKTLSKEQKVRQAEAVIAQLNLTRCKNSIIGGPFLRGVSGGERKRVSIGQEMLINPSVLFLDEPTSGLDSTTAQTIVKTLSELAKGGRTVLMTIHQPSSKLFYMFNKVLLLSDGHPLYFGRGDAVMEYFSSVGFAPLVAMNPADFLLDLANGISPDDSVDDQAAVKASLVSAYKDHLQSKVKQECDECTCENMNDHRPGDKEESKWATTWWEQFSVLLRRGLKERKHESFSMIRVIQVFAIAMLSGLLWWQSDDLTDQVGLLFFYTGFWGFFPLFQAIFTFPPERQMLEKERSSGMYRLSAYFTARMVSDVPMELVLPAAYTSIVYFMAGLKSTPTAFFYNLFSLLFSVLVSQGLGLALGAIFLNQRNATILGSVIMLGFQLAGGYYVQHVPTFINWIKYLSVMQYTFKLLLCSQYQKDDTYPCPMGTCLVKDLPTIKTVRLGEPLFAALMLLLMLVFYRVMAYMALMRIGAPPK